MLSCFLIGVVFGVVVVAAKAAFSDLGSERLPTISTSCLFGWLAWVACAFVCFALVCLNISLPFIQLLLLEPGYIRLLFKLPLKFRNALEHTEIQNSFACNQNIKEDISTAFKVLLCFETKRNETKQNET